MNIYVISNVLTDYGSGMAVIAAKDLAECEKLFTEKFHDPFSYQDHLEEFKDSIKNNHYKVIPCSESVQSGVISYVFGGG